LSNRAKNAKNLLWSFIQSAGSKLLSLVIFAIIARELTPQQFGLVAFATIFIQLSQVFVDAGFSQAIIRHKGLTNLHLNSVFWINIAIGLVATTGLYSFAPLISSSLSQPDLVEPLRAISCVLLIGSFASVQQAQLQKDMHFKVLALRNLLATLIAGSTGVGLAIYGFGVWALIAQHVLGVVVGLVIIWQATSWRPKFEFSISHVKELFAFGRGVLGINLLGQINRKSDDLLIGAFLGSAALGIYSIGFKVFKTLDDAVNGSVRRVLFPMYSKLSGNMDALRREYFRWVVITFSILAPLYISLFVVMPDAIPLVFGDKWSASVEISQCLMLVLISLSINMNNNSVMLALGKSALLLKINIMLTAVMVATFFMVLDYGLKAIALVYVFRSFFVALPVMFFVVQRHLQVSLSNVLKKLLVISIILFICTAIGFYIRQQALIFGFSVYIRVILVPATTAITYLLLLSIFDRTLVTNGMQLIRAWRGRR
jgi:O-antigen/teichoic acid export membrane protein